MFSKKMCLDHLPLSSDGLADRSGRERRPLLCIVVVVGLALGWCFPYRILAMHHYIGAFRAAVRRREQPPPLILHGGGHGKGIEPS
jgi:hypothetical protein